MLAVAAVSTVGYLLSKPSQLQKVKSVTATQQAAQMSLLPVATRSSTDTLPTADFGGDPDPIPDAFPNIPLRGGYGEGAPPYLNPHWQLGDAPGGLKGSNREIYNDPPLPGSFLSMNDVAIAEEVRSRTLMEASQIQTDMNCYNGPNGWAQGMTLVGRPNPQQAQIDQRKYPINSLTKPFSNTYIGPDTRRPNPTSTLGIAYDVTDRTGLFDEVVRLPEKAIPFYNQMGQATAGCTGNENIRPPIYDQNPYEYTRVPMVNCYLNQLERIPQGSYTTLLGDQEDTFREFEGQHVRKKDSALGRVGGKEFVNGEVVYADIAPLKQPLTKSLEARVPGASFNDQADKLGQSQEGMHVSKMPLAADVKRRQATADVSDNYSSQALLPFEQIQKTPYELMIDQQVGTTGSLQLEAGTLLSNPFAIPANYSGRIS